MTLYPIARDISAITNAQVPTITFSEDHGYLVGQLLSFRVGTEYGMYQLNEKQGKVLSVPSTSSITVDIDTSRWGTFSIPGSYTQPNPQALPIGSGIIQESGIFKTNINCSFDNRPP